MPIYEYQCTKCEHRLEALRKISDPPLLECPDCGTPNLNKLVSAASFRLKGGGWYETDFKTGSKKQLAESESASPKSTEPAKSTGGGTASPDSQAKGNSKAQASTSQASSS